MGGVVAAITYLAPKSYASLVYYPSCHDLRKRINCVADPRNQSKVFSGGLPRDFPQTEESRCSDKIAMRAMRAMRANALQGVLAQSGEARRAPAFLSAAGGVTEGTEYSPTTADQGPETRSRRQPETPDDSTTTPSRALLYARSPSIRLVILAALIGR